MSNAHAAKKLKQDTVVTLDSLTLKRSDTIAEIASIQSKIEQLAAGNSAAEGAEEEEEEEEDELDAYMNKINNKAKADDSKKLQKQLQELEKVSIKLYMTPRTHSHHLFIHL